MAYDWLKHHLPHGVIRYRLSLIGYHNKSCYPLIGPDPWFPVGYLPQRCRDLVPVNLI